MEGTEYKTKKSALKRAQEAVGLSLGEIDKTGRISTGKGAIGDVIEESWFGYKPNNLSEPDLPEAGVDVKVTPYIRGKKKISAKERLVICIINYMTEFKKTFEESDFWHKSETLLIMLYGYLKDVPKEDLTIDKVFLFRFPDDDLIIIKQDWEKIIKKIRAGEAHLISESDTLYLAACTKGETAEKSMRKQPFNTVLAKQRAYSLKSGYMTRILNSYIFGKEQDEHIVKDYRKLENEGFENYLINQLSSYYGKTQAQLKELFQFETDAKNANEILLAKMLGLKGRISQTDEFQKAGIVPKSIRVLHTGHIKESMSFPAFKFTEIIKENWETSTLHDYLSQTKFLFTIFQEDEDGEYVFQRVMFWNMPVEDLEKVKKVWEKTVSTIKNGVRLWEDESGRQKNDLPKQKDNPVAHVRPHGTKGQTYPLPDGRKMARQCFWLNNTYIENIIGTAKDENKNSKGKDDLKDYTKDTAISPSDHEYPVVPFGARIEHRSLGSGRAFGIDVRFPAPDEDKRDIPSPAIKLPYLEGTRHDMKILDGRTVLKTETGQIGTIVSYDIVFKDMFVTVSADTLFFSGEYKILPNPEQDK